MKAAIIQSGYLPWIGYFDILRQADIFVFLDDVQWTTRDWRNRNRVRTPQGWSWLTVPITLKKPYFEYCINDVQINYSYDWQKKHLNTIQACYKKSPYFHELYSILESIISRKYKFIVDLNYEVIFALCDYIGITSTKFMFSQEMNISHELHKTDRLLGILKKIGGITTYISGVAARTYLDEDSIKEKGIQVKWHNYKHPYYGQNMWNSDAFIPYLSVVDLLLNHGKESLIILSGDKIIEMPPSIKIVLPE